MPVAQNTPKSAANDEAGPISEEIRPASLFHESRAFHFMKDPSCARGDLNPHALAGTGT